MNFETNRVSQIKLGIILYLSFMLLPYIIGFPIALIEKRYTAVYILLGIYSPIFIAIIVQFVILRKYYLGKVFVNNAGVGYSYKNTPYKNFNWEQITKVKIGQAHFIFYKAEKVNRGKNIVVMTYHLTYKNHEEVIKTCKEICKLIEMKQKEYNFNVYYCNEQIKQLLKS